MTMQESRIAVAAMPGAAERRPTGPGAGADARDRAVDVARAVCLAVVVGLHALMVGVGGTAAAPVLENAMEGWSGFAPLTWIVQVMPLFFVLGGFSAFGQWSRQRERGATAASYVAARLRRLLPPALGAIVATATLLIGLGAAGVPPEVVGEAGFRLGQPLWFLGVYLLCTALVPPMVAAHRARPILTFAALAAAVAAVDMGRAMSGVEGIGFANLLFVWLLAQQLGFLLADGTVDRASAAVLRRIGLTALVAMGVLCATGLSSPDLFAALNPPSAVLVLLGVAQLCGFALLRPRLRRLHALAGIGPEVDGMNRRAMTIYSWHMLVLIGLAGLLLFGGAALPEPLSADWWGSRPLWLAAVAVGVAAVVCAAGRLEDTRRGEVATVSRRRTAVALLGAAGAVLLILIGGREAAVWAAGGAVIAASVALAGGRVGRRRPDAGDHLDRGSAVPATSGIPANSGVLVRA
ncbi:acyltransferase family protein [Microbacterium sp. JZ31]|uniref:acyltransferase family protein n=1 Tax=Microbacterium sp. JZ31 TaxID=1906274 RepID=UPI001934A38F|nr:acyltransferase [Microbacterium sp. JZ31]